MGQSVIESVDTAFAGEARVSAQVSTGSGGLDDLSDADVVIDFSLPIGTALLVDWLGNFGKNAPALVSGTTGLSADVIHRIAMLGKTTKVLQSNNFSTGVTALNNILAYATPMLTRLGYTPVLTEAHHRHKLDAPSGTARNLCDVLAPDAPESVQVHSIRRR